MNVYAIYSPAEVSEDLGVRLRRKRLARNLTQEGLAKRSGVALGTLKKFERCGAISLVSFIRLIVMLGEEALLEQLLADREFETLDEVLNPPPPRRRGRLT